MITPTIEEVVGVHLEPYFPLLGEIEGGSHVVPGDPDHDAWLRARIGAHVAGGARYYACADDSARPVGIMGLVVKRKLFSAPTAEVVDIGVAAPHRRGGLGSKLLAFAVALAEADGASAVFARTYAADTDTIAFYGRNRFHPVAVIPETNGLNDEGDIVMRRRLTP